MTTILKELNMSKLTFYFYITSFLLLLSSCGGGGTGNAVPLPMNTAIVLSSTLAPGFTKTSVPISGIQMTFVLPQNAPPILNSDGSLLVGDTALKDLNTDTSGKIQGTIQGSYDSVTRTVQIALIDTRSDASIGLAVGDIARLTCNLASGAQLSAGEIIPTLSYKVSGPGTENISGEIVPAVRIVTYQKP
jgi:hypothetical protein